MPGPGDRPKPSDWLTQQSPSDFLASPEGQNPSPAAPAGPTPDQLRQGAHAQDASNAAVTAFGKINPPPNPALRVAGEGLMGAESGLGVPETQHPIWDFASGLYHTLTAPPTPGTWEERVAQMGHPEAVLVGRVVGGGARGIWNNLSQSIPDIYHGGGNAAVDLMQGAPATEDLAQFTHGAGQFMSTVLPLRELVGPPVAAAGRAASDTAARIVDTGVGAGPKAVSRASAAAAGKAAEVATANTEGAADVAAGNAKAAAEHPAANEAKLREARDNSAQAHAEALAKQTASDVNWEQGTKDTAAKYFSDYAENEQAHADLTKKIQDENAANKAAVARRGQLEEQLTQSRAQFQNELKATRDADEAAAGEKYGERPEGERDAAQVGQDVQNAVAEKLKGSGAVPAVIQRIISDYTPAEAEGGGVMHDGELQGPGSPIYEQLKSEGALKPEEEATPGATPQKANADMLHGQYSELGRALYDSYRTGAQGDVTASIAAARDVIGGHLKELYKDAGRLPEFNEAQKNYARVMSRYYDRTSPIAKVLNDTSAQAGFDPARAQTGEAPRTSVAERVLKNPENIKVMQRYLRDVPGAPTDLMNDIVKKTAERDSLPKKFTAKQIPVKKEIPVPDLPLRPQVPQPTESPIPGGGLKPPPEPKTFEPQAAPAPFDRQAFIKGKIQDAAEGFMRFSPWETAAAVGAGAELFKGHPELAAGAFAYPVARYSIGHAMESPAFQEWASRDRGLTPPPTTGGIPPGSPTPFSGPPQPPPVTRFNSGNGPIVTPPPAAPIAGPPSLMQRGMDAIRQGAAAGKQFGRDFADTIEYPGNKPSVNSIHWLERNGVKIPNATTLSDGMLRELDSLWKEKGEKITKPEARSAQTVLNTWSKDPDAAINRLRATLGLTPRQGWE